MTNEPGEPGKGTFAGMPFDWRKPTAGRMQKAWWNSEAGLLTPKAYGWGYTINWYRVVHPFKR